MDRSWGISAPSPHPTGKWRTRVRGHAVYGHTPAECLARALQVADLQLPRQGPPTFLAEACVTWLAQATAVNAHRLLAPFTRWVAGQRVHLTGCPRTLLADYQQHLLRKGLAANTVINRVSTARQVLRFCERRGWLARMPDSPRPPPAVLQYRDLSRVELASLFRCLRNRRRSAHVWLAVRFMYWTGARPSEVCSIRWRYINFRDGEIRLPVHKTLRSTGRTRTIYCTRKALQLLQKLKKTSHRRAADDLVFRSERGEPLSWKAIYEVVRRASEACLGYKVHPYQLRHSFAQQALSQAPAEDVARLLGHHGLRYIQVYAQVRDARARSVAGRLRL